MRSGLWPLLTIAGVFTVTQIPFVLGSQWAPTGTVFDGLTGMVQDQHMYFSFIRQGTEGNWIFSNRLTHLDHEAAMVNLEWLAVGWLTALTGASAAYQIWRFIGTALLIWGLWFLLGALGRTVVQRQWTLLLASLGGGFGWLFQILDGLRIYQGAPLGQLDVADGLCYPFAQILLNPHVSVSQGLTLISLGCLIYGEREQRTAWTLSGGIIAGLNGLVRPYDLIVLYAIWPVYLIIERVLARQWKFNQISRQLLPLIITAPVLLYYGILFQIHPVFRYWSSQSVIAPLAIQWHAVNLGLAGVLAGLRVCSLRRIPWTSAGELVIGVWVGLALILFHAHRLPLAGFIPYTPMLGSSLGTLLFVFASAILPSELHQRRTNLSSHWLWRSSRMQVLLLSVLVLFNSCSSVIWLIKIPRNFARLPDHYIPLTDMSAYQWLNLHAIPQDVVLSSLPTGNRVARYASARFVLGHINITPHVKELSLQVKRFYNCELTPAQAESFLRKLRVKWVIYGSEERRMGALCQPERLGLISRFSNDSIIVYENRLR